MKKKIQSLISIILTIGILIGSGFIVNPAIVNDIQIWGVILALFVMFSTQPPVRKSDLLNPNDKYSMMGILVMAIIVYNIAVIEWALKTSHPFSISISSIIGFGMIWGGMALRVYAIKKLAYYFSNITEIKEGHQIIDVGIYGKIRHPSYTGAICTMIGTLVWLEAWNSFAICLGLIAFAYWHRITQEEQLLTKHFGEKYIQYCQKTGLLLPNVKSFLSELGFIGLVD
jgi:protein-S-isoprenylcysteine O-methyltransferase Ste14